MDDAREEAVRTRAHRLWEEDGHPHGRHEEHWARAEREVDAAPDGRSPDGGGAMDGQASRAAAGDASAPATTAERS